MIDITIKLRRLDPQPPLDPILDPVTGEVIFQPIAFVPLRNVALEVQALNQFAGTPEFPRPIPCNPDSEQVEGFLGLVNTPPDPLGRVNVRIDYEFLDLSFLPATPQTFTFILGKPDLTGSFA